MHGLRQMSAHNDQPMAVRRLYRVAGETHVARGHRVLRLMEPDVGPCGALPSVGGLRQVMACSRWAFWFRYIVEPLIAAQVHVEVELPSDHNPAGRVAFPLRSWRFQ